MKISNRKLYTNNYSGYKGIHWDKHRCKWFTRINIEEQSYFLGRFKDFDDAVEAIEKTESAISLMKGMNAENIHITNTAHGNKVTVGILSKNEFQFKFEIHTDLYRTNDCNIEVGKP